MNRALLVILFLGYCQCFESIRSETKSNDFEKFVEEEDIKPLQYFPKVQYKNLHQKPQQIPLKNEIQRIFGEIEIPDNLRIYFQVGLDLFLEYGQKAFCGGSLISRRFILTAANCLDRTVSATVILGAENRVSPIEATRVTQPVNPSNFIIHPNWDRNTARNNIALIRLTERITINTGVIDRIPYADGTIGLLEGVAAGTSGWGYFNTSNILSPVLRATVSTIISNAACQEFYGNLVDPTNMCIDGSQGTTGCVGDIGGPLAIVIDQAPVLVGITSFGSLEGCDKLHPTVFTRVSAYAEWIQTNTA